MAQNLGSSRTRRSQTETNAAPVAAEPGRHFGARSWVRPLAGAITVLVIAAVIAAVAGLFRGSFTKTVPVTLISDRAGLVMNPDAKVKMRDVQVGTVASIDERPGGGAVLHLAMDPSRLHLIPANVSASIASSTVFGAKYVELEAPPEAPGKSLQSGQVIDGDHVSVETNTIFEQLTSALDAVPPERLNQTLTALASAIGGRGERLGRAMDDLSAGLGDIEPSLDALRHDLKVSPQVFGPLADAAPDFMRVTANATAISRTIVSRQKDLDLLLVSVIGFADIGNEVIGGNQKPLSDVLHMLAPVTGLTSEYHQALYCMLAGAVELTRVPPLKSPGAEVIASLEWGADPYRYPSDLPKVAATGGPQCVGLPRIPFEHRPPYVVADVGTNPWEYGNRGVELNTAGLKAWLLGQTPDGPPRNTAQIGMPG